MNLEKVLYGVIGVSTLVLIFAIIKHISIRIFNEPTVLGVYIAIALGFSALVILIGDLLIDWIKSRKKDNE